MWCSQGSALQLLQCFCLEILWFIVWRGCMICLSEEVAWFFCVKRLFRRWKKSGKNSFLKYIFFLKKKVFLQLKHSMSRILAWGRRAVIQQDYSLGLWKVVLFLLTKITLLAYPLAMAIKSLIYYIAFFDSEDSNLYRSVINILYRGINAEAQPVTLVLSCLVWDSVFFSEHWTNKVLSLSLPDIFRDRGSGCSLGGRAAPCAGSALSGFHLGVGDGATYCILSLLHDIYI